LPDRFNPMRLLFDLAHQHKQEYLKVSLLRLMFAINQRGQMSLGQVGEHGRVLQVIDGRHGNCEPLLNGFKGLQTEVSKTKAFFEIEIIDFDRFANYNLIGETPLPQTWRGFLG